MERQLPCGGCQRGIDGSFSQELRDQVSGIAPDFAVATLTVTLTEAIPVYVQTVTNVRLVVTYTDEAGGTHVIDKALEASGAGNASTGNLQPEMEEKEIPLDAEVEFKLVLHGGVEGSPDQVFTTRLALVR